jgi:phosphatidylserine/phosphatidylglycerophosphate/cardiolipin synthase-like enzyme
MVQRSTSEGLTVKAHRGEGAVLLAFDATPALALDLAGFAVEYTTPDGETHPLTNRLTFDDPIVAGTTPERRQEIATDTSEAPLQKFHWVHYPPPQQIAPGRFRYRVTAMRFAAGSDRDVVAGPHTSVDVELVSRPHRRFALGFTRGYVSSQAYAERFGRQAPVPDPASIDDDTRPFAEKYRWLGFRARELLFAFLQEAIDDPEIELDVFAYDLDEPDFVHGLARLGSRLRILLDNSDDHTFDARTDRRVPPEVPARALLERSAGGGNVKPIRFGRFSHDKVMIQKRGGRAVKVLSGSANFTVRGLYVQSNNVFVFDDPATAGLYETAFKQAFEHDADEFATSRIASGWIDGPDDDALPRFAVSFAPHVDAEVSLARVTEAIESARDSVLFAIMDVDGGGSTLDAVRHLPRREALYAFGTTQTAGGDLTVTAPGREPVFVPFSYLKSKVPAGFRREIAGGGGKVIHHKFVVCDFNGRHPVAFAGSSNLAGGERANGDNLVAFTDPEVATAFAVEAIRLIDHYRFRAVQQTATETRPLRLKRRGEDWTADYFVPGSQKSHERKLFVR